MHLKLKRTPGIYLAGFMGTGKSTVGRLVAEQLGWDFFDLDTEIEKRENATIPELFETRGEAGFRLAETEALAEQARRVECGMPRIISLGGGAFSEPGNYELIENHGISVWIDCSFEVIQKRLAAELQDRPNARDPERFRQLFEERKASYARADFRVDGDGEPVQTAAAIVALPIWR